MTQQEKVIAWMARYPEKQWWYAPDFMQRDMPAEFFVGYEASAVISTLTCKKDRNGVKKPLNPEVFDTKRVGKYRYIRLRFDNFRVIRETHPRWAELIEYWWRVGTGKLVAK